MPNAPRYVPGLIRYCQDGKYHTPVNTFFFPALHIPGVLGEIRPVSGPLCVCYGRIPARTAGISARTFLASPVL